MLIDLSSIALLIVLNGIFAMSEMAIVSARKVRLQQKTDGGSRGAYYALQLAEQPTRFLSTIQVGITSIGILSGALGEEAIGKHLREYFNSNPALTEYADQLALVCMVGIMTYASLIIGELVPKRLALLHPEAVASALARPMHWLSLIALPLVKFLSLSTDLALRLMGVRAHNEPSITEEEIKVLLEQGTVEGVFERTEQQLVENILRLDDRKVGAIMTPRKDVVYLDLHKNYEENRQRILDHPHWVIPVCKNGLDNVIGFVKTKDMLNRLLVGDKVDLMSIATPALYVPKSLTLMQLLEQFKKSHLLTALVINEYGEIDGLASMTDVLEAIVGDIPSESEDDEPRIVQREDGSWLVDGMLDIEDFKSYFDINEVPEEGKGNFHTVGGFIMLHLGSVPKATDTFEFGPLRLEVVDMDRNRVDKVLVSLHDNH